MNFAKELRIKPGKHVKLSHYSATETLGYEKGPECKKHIEKAVARLDALQDLLYADNKRSILILLQGMDAAGKDGTIRHVMSGVNPQGCSVTSFKVPSHAEAQHDFLWRAHLAVPGRGQIGIFNRSYYEDVLVVRVHKLAPEEVWKKRYEQINNFEAMLAENNVTLLKFFLHISKDEQKRRFEARLNDPSHQWKLSPADLAETKILGRLCRSVRSGVDEVQHGGRAVVRDSRELQMVPESGGFADYCADAGRLPLEISQAVV